MKPILTVAGCLLAFSLQAQSLADKIAASTCACLGQVANADTLQQRLQRCAPLAMTEALATGSAADKKALSTVEGIQGTFQRVSQLLPTMCPAIQQLAAGAPKSAGKESASAAKEKEEQYYHLSASAEANKRYEAGNALMEKKDYKAALKQFEKAVALDPQFVFALDHVAICHRQLGHYDDALTAYDRSLAIYPEGTTALLNKAVVYSLKQDWDNARKYYALLQQYHPDDPEGYFGLGKLALLNEDHELAMTNLFKVHRLYVDTDSPYVEDSKKLLTMLYVQMKKANKTEEFLSRAKEYNIKFNVVKE